MKMATSDKKEELVWSGEDASNLRSLKFNKSFSHPPERFTGNWIDWI